MNATPTRPAPCPQCGKTWPRPVAIYGGREMLAAVPVLCRECSREATAQAAADTAWRKHWQRMPADYRRADANHPDFTAALAALEWDRARHPGGVGIVGPAGTGKSMALACLLRRLRLPFRWESGTSARQAHLDAATGERADGSAEQWRALHTCAALAIDDLSQWHFTESGGSALFGLLEARRSARLPTFWTCQKALPDLRALIFSRTKDSDQADAISRRLGQASLIIHTAP